MVKAGLSPPRPALRTILRAGGDAGRAVPCPDALLVTAGRDLPERLSALGRALPVLVRLPCLDDLAGLDVDALVGMAAGVVLGRCADAGDLVRLGTRLGVAEARAGLPDGTVFTVAELAPAALLAPMGLGAAKPRLGGLLHDAGGLEQACGAAAGALATGGAGDVTRCLVALAAAALDLPAYDGASGDDKLDTDAAEARRLGFRGKLAAHRAQLPALSRIFV